MSPAGVFREALASDAVETRQAERELLSADISGMAERPADVVLAPRDAAELAALVRIARREGVALFPRGGGLSYTRGHMPSRMPAALVDTRRLGGIALDRDAGTVTAGAGVTWAELFSALDAEGLRLPSFGPLSGLGATIGGGVSQNGGFFGSAAHGPYGEATVLASHMVDGRGEPVTISRDQRAGGGWAPQPLAGDCGAFGIRSAVTLRAIPRPATTGFLSFGFDDGDAALSALAALEGTPGLGEAYVFDPGTHANLARGGFSVLESAGIAGDLLAARGSLWERVGGLLRTARAARATVAELRWSLHVALDGSAAEVEAVRAETARRVAVADGDLLPDVIPRVTRARPFRPIKALLGPAGELWLPLHGILPTAAARGVLRALDAALAEEADAMAREGVRVVLLAMLMRDRIVIEPQLFWPDALTPLHRALARPEQVAAHGAAPARPAARALAHRLRARLTQVLDAAGAGHFQIGRSYAGHPGVDDAVVGAWRVLKSRHDPDDIMNPGVLGLSPRAPVTGCGRQTDGHYAR
jgi:FAD/FMN-containing dehydrogenase